MNKIENFFEEYGLSIGYESIENKARMALFMKEMQMLTLNRDKDIDRLAIIARFMFAFKKIYIKKFDVLFPLLSCTIEKDKFKKIFNTIEIGFNALYKKFVPTFTGYRYRSLHIGDLIRDEQIIIKLSKNLHIKSIFLSNEKLEDEARNFILNMCVNYFETSGFQRRFIEELPDILFDYCEQFKQLYDVFREK